MLLDWGISNDVNEGGNGTMELDIPADSTMRRSEVSLTSGRGRRERNCGIRHRYVPTDSINISRPLQADAQRHRHSRPSGKPGLQNLQRLLEAARTKSAHIAHHNLSGLATPTVYCHFVIVGRVIPQIVRLQTCGECLCINFILYRQMVGWTNGRTDG